MTVMEVLRERLLKGNTSDLGLADDPAKHQLPNVWELCTKRVGVQEKRKMPASLRIEATETGWRATISDLEISYALAADSEYLGDLLTTLDRLMTDPKAPWRELRHGVRAGAIKSESSKKKPDWEK